MATSLNTSDDQFPVISDRAQFDVNSGNWLERTIFNNRLTILVLFVLISIFLGWKSVQLNVNANFERMIPNQHPYVKNFLDNKSNLRGLGNQLRIVVENKQGDIYDPGYLKALAEINDAIYLIPGVDRPWLKSLWTPLLRWTGVTEEGLEGGPVMPDRYDGSPESIERLKANIARSGAAGRLISSDQKSSMIVVPLLDAYADTGKPIDYARLSRDLEDKVRSKSSEKINVHIVGFGKLVGDLIEGLTTVISYFAISILIAALFVYSYTRCVRSTVILTLVSALGVMWLMGLLQLLHYELDPYSILVPFLLFAIGLSHGAQKMNGIMQDIGRGTDKYVAARYTFRRLFVAGVTALMCNVVGFMVLIIIEIPVIRDLAIMTSIGVGGLIFTKLFLIPVILSYVGVSPMAAKRSLKAELEEDSGRSLTGRMWQALDLLTERRWALVAIACAVVLTGLALTLRPGLKIGDLDKGAPELRSDSRYNLDNAYISDHYGLSSDQFAVIVKTDEGKCDQYRILVDADRLGWELQQVPGVRAVTSFADQSRGAVMGISEGYYKWSTFARNPSTLGYATNRVIQDNPDTMSANCAGFPVVAYLADHKAETLAGVLKVVEKFAKENSRAEVQFLPAAGSAGVEAVTNIVVEESFYIMHGVLYLAVIVLCYITFRSWRAVVVALIPLIITSLLCEAIMVMMGIGVKVATLPVIALGVGVGVDYALYLLSIQLTIQRQGGSLRLAYKRSLQLTGKVVALVGVTMAAGVVTWVWSPIKFQADMGILLTFMFLWNMIGALLLIPPLSHFLLRDVRRSAAAV